MIEILKYFIKRRYRKMSDIQNRENSIKFKEKENRSVQARAKRLPF